MNQQNITDQDIREAILKLIKKDSAEIARRQNRPWSK